MPERSIHDNRIVSYEVDGDRRRIALHTRFETQERRESTDLVFEGVLAYHFENDNFSNILLGVHEIPVAQLVERERGRFEEGFQYAWPGPWNVSTQAAIDHLQSKGARAFEIQSAYGLAGWVVAESYRLEDAA